MKDLFVAMWPVWVALAATLICWAVEARQERRQVAATVAFLQRHPASSDFRKWEFEFAVDQAIRLGNEEEL